MVPRTKGAREQARKKARVFFSLSGVLWCLSAMALVILLSPPDALALTAPPVPALAAAHLASLGLLGYTVFLQARALAFDHASVDWKLLLLGYDAVHRRYLALPALLMGIAVDLVIVCLFIL